MKNSYEEYSLQLLKEKESHLNKLIKDKKDYGDSYEMLFNRLSAQIDLIYIILTGHSSVINPYADEKGNPIKNSAGKLMKKEFDDWNKERERILKRGLKF